MSLWYESLGLCLDDCGDDAEERARCILAHLSMDVPRSWWEHALQAGSIPKGYANILQDLHEELLKTSKFTEGIGFGLLVALAFADDDIDQQLPRYGTVYWECSVDQYLAKAKEILAKRPALGKLGQAIENRSIFLNQTHKTVASVAGSHDSLKGKKGNKVAKKDVVLKGKSEADKLTEMFERGDFDDLIEKELACEIRLTLSAEDRKFFDKEEGLTEEDIKYFESAKKRDVAGKNGGRHGMRGLSQKFIGALKEEGGILHAILERIQNDDTLMLAIRNGYINIYYRGGNLLKITESRTGLYEAHFDKKYDLTPNQSIYNDLNLPKVIKALEDTDKWVSSVPCLKEIMDFWFGKHPKQEREFQQLVERENNRSSISNETEYFITDIEFADSSMGLRFDALAIKWPASKRKYGNKCRPALIEIKYGDNALDGKSGLLKHLKDIYSFVSDSKRYNDLLDTMETQFNQLDQLGLLKHNRCSNGTKVKLDAGGKPEVIIVLANHNPRSSKLKKIINDPEIDKYDASPHFDLRFFVASFAGYGLHADCMLTLADFRQRLSYTLPAVTK